MDTAISKNEIVARRNKTIVIILMVVIAIIAAVFFLRSGLQSSIKQSEITTSVVEMGTIDNTLNASGEVIPEFEQVISSPINASIKDVIRDAGSVVKAGDVILSLDKAATQVEYERLKFQLESKRNSIIKLKLDLNKAAYDTRSDNDIRNKQQTMRVDIREAEIAAAIEESGLNELGRKLRESTITRRKMGREWGLPW